jgi:hypothetical protein
MPLAQTVLLLLLLSTLYFCFYLTRRDGMIYSNTNNWSTKLHYCWCIMHNLEYVATLKFEKSNCRPNQARSLLIRKLLLAVEVKSQPREDGICIVSKLISNTHSQNDQHQGHSVLQCHRMVLSPSYDWCM